MDLEYEHNFEQLAWIQISQFNATDLLEAINQTTIYEDLPRTWRELQSYNENNVHKKHFIKLLYKSNAYIILEQWVIEEGKRAQFKDLYHEVPLDYVGLKSLTTNHHPTSSPNHTLYEFDEEWGNVSVSSSPSLE